MYRLVAVGFHKPQTSRMIKMSVLPDCVESLPPVTAVDFGIRKCECLSESFSFLLVLSLNFTFSENF